MGDGVNTEENPQTMGASSNSNAARLAALQERKQNIEETLAKRNQELRQLCIQEAELTGTMPQEIPLEPGESSPPVFRRRVGTSFQLPQNLINNLNNEDESISSLELSKQVQANMAEAALSLASEAHLGKTIRRQHMAQYQYHKKQYNALEEKLAFLKGRSQMSQQNCQQQQKQKKKPRPSEQDDTASVTVNLQQADPFPKSVLRHSIRSLQHPLPNEATERSHQKLCYRNSEGSSYTDLSMQYRTEDALVSGIYRMSLNGYKNYMERKENRIINNQHMLHYPSHSNSNLYQQQLPYVQMGTHNLLHGSQRIQQPIHEYMMYPHSQYSPTQSQMLHDYTKYHSGGSVLKQSSPNGSQSKSYYPPAIYPSRPYSEQYRINPHQIQPHQQYEHDIMTTVGLGGYWKRTESGELVWYNSAHSDTWQHDKRFGSLDRRRNKRLHKRNSPLVDPKSATISATTMPYTESMRPASSKLHQITGRRQDNRQLVRTQSLGSVGTQTIDSVWPSDDNSSCGSEAHSISEIHLAARKHKQKEWFETSLDGPAMPTPSRSQSTVSSTVPSISPEEKYMEVPPQLLPSPKPHKPPLEIPAQSNPTASPTVPEPNMQLFNNQIPKNGTLIQAGHCRPYHEETKPFEMSDFYKYSTKFKKSPVKQNEIKSPDMPPLPASTTHRSLSQNFESPGSPQCLNQTLDSPTPLQCNQNIDLPMSPVVQRNLNQSFEDDNNSIIHKGIYQPLQPMKCQPLTPNNNFDQSVENINSPMSINSSLDLSQFTPNVAENFSAEMNAWYKNHEQQIDNNNSRQSSNRSTATLV